MWALVRNWYEKGRPPAGSREMPFRIAGFAEWSDIFGGIMEAAGYANPLQRPKGDEQSASPYTVHQRKLVEILATNLDAKSPLMEYTAQELIDCCVENDLFSWKIKGRAMSKEDKEWYEPTSECWSVMGLMWTKEMGGRVFAVGEGRRVKLGKKGEGRQKRYTVELLQAAPPRIVVAT